MKQGLEDSGVDITVIGQELGRLIQRNKKFFEKADELGINANYILDAYKDIVDNATTVDKEWRTIVDYKSKAIALKQLGILLWFGSANASLKNLNETLGIKKEAGNSINFNFTKLLRNN